MYVIDGIAYAGEPAEDLQVKSAKVTNDLCMLVTFSSGETRVFDASGLVSLEAFEPLKTPSIFNAFDIEQGVLTWCDGDIDIAPEALYQRSYRYDKTA